MILAVTVTKDRPKPFNDYLTRWVNRQTTKADHWLIVCDGWEGYKFPNKATTVIKRDNSDDKLPSICENWKAALDWIETHEQYEKIIVLEDDDWYVKDYIHETSELLEKADLVGWENDAYYYVLSRKARRFHNIGHASLAATGFKRSVLPFMRECVEKGEVFIDLNLWHGIGEQTLVSQPPLATSDGKVTNLPPVPYRRIVSSYQGKKILADNFTGQLQGKKTEMKWGADGKVQIIHAEPTLDEHGNILDEHPRHVGLKEPWHGGIAGLSERGHSFMEGGGPDGKGRTLIKWMGKEDAAMYLRFTKEITSPYPSNVMIELPMD